MTAKEYGALFLLSALWGGSFLFMRIAAPVLGPVLLIELRVGLAGLALLAYALFIRKVPELRRHWRAYAVVPSCCTPPPLSPFQPPSWPPWWGSVR